MAPEPPNTRVASPRAGSLNLKIGPMAALIDPPKFSPPALALPPLETLEVRVPRPAPLTADVVTAEVQRRARRASERRERATGERVAMGDELCVDFFMTCGDELVPFTTEFDDWRDLEPLPALPGVSETIAECGVVGQCVLINLRLPDDFLFEALRGKPARIVVGIHRAFEVTPPSGNLFQKAGLGANLDQATAALHAETEAALRSRANVDRLVSQELARHVTWEPPASLVDHEILCRWAEKTGRPSTTRSFSVAQQRELLGHWLAAPWIRAEATERLRASAALWSIASAEQLVANEAQVLAFFAAPTADAGFGQAEVAAGLGTAGPEVRRRVKELAAMEAILEYVRSRIRLTFL